MKAKRYLEIAIETGVATLANGEITFDGQSWPNTEAGRNNCGTAIALKDGEDTEL